jgi:cellulose synthase/poly-beta-1,6-N-acetylglucosamine synthase-like glycosyltransferase
VRWLATAVVVAGILSTSPWLAYLAVLVWAAVWATSRAIRRTVGANLKALKQLRHNDAVGNSNESLPHVTAIVAARNEEKAVEEAVRSLASLDYPCLTAIAVNDHSTDGTGGILDRLAGELPRLRVIHDPPEQEGWLGKANAVWHAVQNCDPAAKWLLFTDADVVFHPMALRRAVAHAERRNVDLLTVLPRLVTGTWSERLTLPLKWRDLVASARLDHLNSPSYPPYGIGAFMLVKRETYDRSGGHSAIRASLPDDTLLAAAIRKTGGTLDVAWTNDLLSIRMYNGWRDMSRAWARKSRIAGSNRLAVHLARIPYLLLHLILPLPWCATGVLCQLLGGAVSIPVLLGIVIAGAAYLETVRAMMQVRAVCDIPGAVPWLHPIGGILRLWIECLSVFETIVRRPKQWRGRSFS